MAKGKFVSYLRVSTDKQGRSGLGLEAQREAVKRYVHGGDWKIAAEYVETETGNGEAVEATKAKAQRRAGNSRAMVADVRAPGVVRLRQLAHQPCGRGILTPRAGRWHPTSVVRLLTALGPRRLTFWHSTQGNT